MRRFLPIAAALLLPTAAAQTSQTPLRSQFEALSKSMESAPADQRLAYNALFVAFATFRDAHLRHETCHAAAGCAALQTAERDRLSMDFLALAQGPVTATPPPATYDLVADDAALNTDFEQAIAALPASCPATDATCLSQPVFRDAQRDWIRYRDALVTYEGLRWPRIPASFWLAYMTRQRSGQIRAAFHP